MNPMSEDIFETPSSTPNFQTELAERLADLVPEAVADGKIDVLKLQELLADDAADSSERYGLFWPGKRRALNVAQQSTTASLRPSYEDSRNWETSKNIFIEGDNLEALKILQKHYHGKIKVIYIDPPYNTGHDFVYSDSFADGVNSYLDWTKQVNEEGKKVSTNSETEGRYHSNWLNMMYPRLKLARNLLSEDGIIFISIDDHEIDNLLKLGKEIFGESNHVTTFIWKNKTGGGNDSKDVTSEHEYCVLYARNISWVTKLVQAVDNAETYTNSDEHLNQRGPYKLEALYRSSLRYSESLVYPIYAPDGSPIYPNDSNPESTKHIWRWSKSTFEQKMSEGRVEFRQTSNGWRVFSKQYLLQDDDGNPRSKGLRTVLDMVGSRRGTEEVKALFGGLKLFDYPKPIDYLKHYIKATTSGSDIILDFFAGSGSTAHAVMSLNLEDGMARQTISVQIPEPTDEQSEARKAGYKTIAEISRARIKLAAEALEKQSALELESRTIPLDLGLRAFRLSESCFSKWTIPNDISIEGLEEQLFQTRDSADNDARMDDLLFEILLKQGHSLTERIEDIEVAGLKLKSVGGSLVIAYLEEKIKPDLDAFTAVVNLSPAKFIVLEDAFQGDDELKTNLAQVCKSKNIELWTA
jgi:adenine-specific DNA-methyltransferase